MKILRAFGSSFIIVASLVLAGCRSGHSEGWSSRARTMILTSGPTEISLSSSRVPGYWAREVASEQEFFLYTSARAYEKGMRVTVEGPFGSASPAVFRDETGEYLGGYPLYILVVWKIGREAQDHGSRL
jgi:hypothetical protein